MSLTEFIFGFYCQECDIRSTNIKSANENPEEVDKKLSEEISLGRVAGPFDEPPFKDFKCSPLSLREKSTPSKFWLQVEGKILLWQILANGDGGVLCHL